MTTVFQNVTRLNHLLSLFRLSSDELLDILSRGLVNPITEETVFSDTIKLSTLKKIDKIFNKGLSYYVDPAPISEFKEESIFFRKDNFNANLNLAARQFVNRYEEKKIYFESILKLTDTQNKRKLPVFSLSDSPKKVAAEVRGYIYPYVKGKTKDFLKALISNLAEQNVLVLEYVEHPSKIEKANVNGFFLSPDVIVIKWQKYTKRELFTLAHEIGHYLLNEEEIDENIDIEIPVKGVSKIENWCNEFAFQFLIGDYNIDILSNANSSNDYHDALFKQISNETHLSTLSLYTRLLNINKISSTSYSSISNSIKEFVKNQLAEEQDLLELNKLKAEEKGETFSIGLVKPIISPFYLQTLRVALYNGVLDEYEFCNTLNIKADKIDAYLV